MATRDEVLDVLVTQEVITAEEAESIRSWSKADDSEDIILGYVVSLGTQPGEISQKLQGTKLSRAPETIKAQALPVAAGPIGQTAEAFSSAMRADEGELTVGDLISNVGSALSGVFDQGGGEGRVDRRSNVPL